MRNLKAIFPIVVFCSLLACSGIPASGVAQETVAGEVILADFSDYPGKWKARGGWEKADKVYEVVTGETGAHLRARVGEDSVRIFKKIPWNSLDYPMVQWKWRVNKWPPGGDPKIYVYVSLDRDFFGIPTINKYIWTRDGGGEGFEGGGNFRPAEKVIRSGAAPEGEWITETIDALAGFREVSKRDPKGEAYGIGFLADPGIEVDFGPVLALPR